jgi:hypothetical protein
MMTRELYRLNLGCQRGRATPANLAFATFRFGSCNLAIQIRQDKPRALAPMVLFATELKGWMNRLTTFQARSKAQLVNYFVRGRQNVNTVSKATGEE